MKRKINFAVVNNGDQEMIVNFHPPLDIDDDDDTPYKFTKLGQIKETLSAMLMAYDGVPGKVFFDEHAIEQLSDQDNITSIDHYTVFGSKMTATFDKVGVRLKVDNGSMVVISAGGKDLMIAVKPEH
jgi:hypothetical protein